MDFEVSVLAWFQGINPSFLLNLLVQPLDLSLISSFGNPCKRIPDNFLGVKLQRRIFDVNFLLLDDFLFVPIRRIYFVQFLIPFDLRVPNFDISLIFIVHLKKLFT